MIRLIFGITFSLCITSALGQDISKDAAIADFDECVASLKQLHPNLYQYHSKESFDSVTVHYQNQIDSTINQAQLHVLIRKLIAQTGCGHLLARPSNDWYQLQKEQVMSMPIRVVVENNRIYLKEIHEEEFSLRPCDEIISINGIAASTMLEDMGEIQERDGTHTTFVEAKIERLFSTYFLFLYGPFSSFEIAYLRDGKTMVETISSGPKPSIKSDQYNLPEGWSKKYEMGQGVFYASPNENISLLSLQGFYRKKYKRFYKDVFSYLSEQGTDTLVIDLRGNGGGNFQHGMHLLRYAMNDKVKFDFYKRKTRSKKSPNVKMDFASAMTGRLFNTMPDHVKSDSNRNYLITKKPMKKGHFDGHINVLLDGGSYSMSGYVASQLTKRDNVVFIGEQSGGGAQGSNAILFYSLTLPNSGIKVRIPHYHLDHLVSKELGLGGVPVQVSVDREGLICNTAEDRALGIALGKKR